MRRLLTLVMLIVSADISLGEESPPPKQIATPTGTWTHTSEDGSKITLSIEEKKVSWTAELPENGTTTMSCASYQISEEGVLFGYMREIWWTNGVEQRSLKELFPFAFRFEVDGDKLVMTELRLFGADQKGHAGYMGTYRKVLPVGVQSKESRATTTKP